MAERAETHAWRIRLRLSRKEVDMLSSALFEMDGITETWPNMTIYFSLGNFALFMTACRLLPKPVDITKLDFELVDMKQEPEMVHCRHMTPRRISKLQIEPKES